MTDAVTYALGQGTGPLAGVKVVEIAGIGPGPHACMILADLGADVIRVERPGGQMLTGGPTDLLNRGRPSVALDLKRPEAVATVLDLVEQADVLVEGMRPGTTERLGLGPDVCLARNPRLVYGRMTGWGQTGPLASAAGHDMNYIAITGALYGMGQDRSRPQFPANLVGDFGGGSTYLVIGILAALLEARVSGQGPGRGRRDRGRHRPPERDVLRDARGRHPARGAGAATCWTAGCRSTTSTRPPTAGTCRWARWSRSSTKCSSSCSGSRTRPTATTSSAPRSCAAVIAARFATRTQAEWTEVFEGTDACVAPILPLTEAMEHPHIAAREVFVEHEGVRQPAPAPRFSRTEQPRSACRPGPSPGPTPARPSRRGGSTDVDSLLENGVAVQT